MSLAELLSNTPKPWCDIFVNKLVTADQSKGKTPFFTVPARLIVQAGSLNNVVKIGDAIITKVGTVTTIFTSAYQLTQAEMNVQGTVTIEVDYEFPKIAEAEVTSYDISPIQAYNIILPIEMRSQTPSAGKTRFTSLRTDILRSIGGADKRIGSALLWC